MALLGRREPQAGSIEEEREALRRQRLDAARELAALKQELAERVSAVQERERQLGQALAKAASGGAAPAVSLPRAQPSPDPAVAARAAALGRREKELDEREARLSSSDEHLEQLEQRARELEQRERALTARAKALDEREREVAALERDPDEEKLRKIEERLAELKEAEQLFLRTQQELADRSEAVAARERLVGERERELEERDGWQGGDLAELERRLRRLEQGTGEITQSFSSGLSKLRQQGSRRPPG